MVELQINVTIGNKPKFDLVFPSSWDELTPEQLLYIGRHWNSWKKLAARSKPLINAKARLFLELCGLKTAKEKRRLAAAIELIDEKSDVNILSTTDFIFRSEKLKFTKNLLPSIQVGRKFYSGGKFFVKEFYHGPADRLGDISIDEFTFAFTSFSNYNRTGQEKDLNNLIAVLYRPYNKNYLVDGLIKIPFNNRLIELHAQKTAKLKPEVKQAVLLFFMGCMENLQKRYPRVFRRAEKNEAIGGSFNDTVVEISGDKFGTFNETKIEDAHLVLKYLDNIIKKNLENNSKKK